MEEFGLVETAKDAIRDLKLIQPAQETDLKIIIKKGT